ncbi:MAG: AMP-binding protein, partial [Porticoccaceae bacterium]|nr:AMP-binding protein [Porticoccaceae bacterium]
MTKIEVYPVPENWSETAWINQERYKEMYRQSIENPDFFWGQQASEFLSWDESWNTVSQCDFAEGRAEWFSGGKLNVSVNCIDRHLPLRAHQTAIIWEGDDPSQDKKISYQELYTQVSKMGNLFRKRGVKKGDRVCIYMPMIPEATYAMLACARIGAIHSVVFGGFSPEALKDRILDSDCRLIVTADEGYRGGKSIPLKRNVDIALRQCPQVHSCVVVERTGGVVTWEESRDIWYHQGIEDLSGVCIPASMGAEDPLFILYTSGSTGKPKGVMHTTAGYLLMAAMSHKYTFDYKEG